MLLRKCQKLCVALVAMCLWIPSTSWALGLGEIEVESALNERFSATINLLDAAGLQTSEIIISMASKEDFDRVGVERFFYLTAIAFEVKMDQGGPKVIVTSSQPIAEPYLDFIVEVKWPSGRLLKEYTVLLDPPTFSETVAAPVRPPAQPIARSEPQTSAPTPRVTRQPTRVAAPAESAGRRSTPVSGDGLMTTRSDTLWTIAESTLPSNRVSINQQMLAIQRLNREAFIKDNINLLKAGYRLQIPSEDEALSLSSSEANLTVANQTNAWRSGDAAPAAIAQTQQATPLVDDGESLRSPIDATEAQPTAAAPTSDGEGRVRIVATTGEASTGSAGGTDVEVNQLIEEKSSLERQVDELTYQLDREKEIAANQVSVKERQLDVKDQEIAQLQEQMKQMREQLDSVAQNQNQNTNDTAVAEQAWWMSPLFLGGVIGLLVLFLAFMMVALRRSRQDNDALAEALDDSVPYDADEAVATAALAETDDAFDEVGDAAPQGQQEPTIGAVENLATDPSIDELADVATLGDRADAGATADDEAETGDVIGEAEIYIAYGRYGQAANLLINVLNNEPERDDVRLKLLEVFAESGDEEQFAQHAQYLVDNCEDEEVLMACRELEGQLNAGTVALNDIGDSADTGNGSDDMEGADAAFNLDADDATDISELDEQVAADIEGVKSASDEFELEFDEDALDDAADTLQSARAQTSSAAVDDLGGDLGLDFDPDRDIPEIDDSASDLTDLGAAALGAETSELDAPDELEFSLDDFADDEVAAPLETTANDLDIPTEAKNSSETEDDGFEFDGGGDADINATKIDLAEAYIDMGDADGARDILAEVADEGTTEQKEQARKMLESLNG